MIKLHSAEVWWRWRSVDIQKRRNKIDFL